MIRTALVIFALTTTMGAAQPQVVVVPGYTFPRPAPTAEELEQAGEILIGRIPWLEQPAAQDYANNYPQEALDHEREGRVVLDCIIQADGYLACAPQDDGAEFDFERATLAVAAKLRAAPQTEDGQPTAGRRIRRTFRWVLVQ